MKRSIWRFVLVCGLGTGVAGLTLASRAQTNYRAPNMKLPAFAELKLRALDAGVVQPAAGSKGVKAEAPPTASTRGQSADLLSAGNSGADAGFFSSAPESGPYQPAARAGRSVEPGF